MPSFRYKAYTADGKSSRGILEADSRSAALQMLVAQGETPFELQLSVGQSAGAYQGTDGSKVAVALNDAEMASLFGGLTVLLNAGFNLDRALAVAQETESSKKLGQIHGAIRKSIASGAGVAKSFSANLSIPSDVTAILASAEASSAIALSIERIERMYGDRDTLRKKVIAAISYPAFLIAVLILVLVLLAVELVPAMEPIFTAGDAQMPALMRALLVGGQVIEGHWRLIAIALLLLLVVLFYPPSRVWLGRQILALASRLPLIGTFVRRSMIAGYLNTLTLMVDAQLPLVQALELAANSVRLARSRQTLLTVARSVNEGRPLHSALEGTGLFENYVISLVAMGIRSNNLAQMLGRGGDLMEKRLSEAMTRFLAILSPAITIAVGLIVGGLVISVMTALLSINEVAIR